VTLKTSFEQFPKSAASNCNFASPCKVAGPDASGCVSCASRSESNQNARIALTLEHITYTLFVMSGKGGVGKSSVTVNVAVGLALKGFNVGILDVDIHGPSVSNLLGLGYGLGVNEAEEKLIPVEYLPNLHVISIDSLLRDKNTAIMWRGPKKTAAIRRFLSDVQWGGLDFLVIDSPPGTGDEHLTILKTIPEALSIMVTTPQEISLADVRKAINFLQHARGKILGIVENMSGLCCPNCGSDIPLFKKGGGKTLAEQYDIPFLGAIALDPSTVVAADMGKPVILLKEHCAAKQDFLALTDAVAKAAQQGAGVVLPQSEG
jgi:Mrp family chromosome partitioning ATPase